MLTDFSVIEGPYLRDILDQSRALEQTLAGLEVSKSLSQIAGRVQKGKFQTIILTGMGGSYHALHPLNLQLVSEGLASIMVETSELIHYHQRLLTPKTLILAISQSGQSAETVRLLQSNRGKSPVIGITNTPSSPLAKRAAAAVLTNAGTEFSVSCKTYVSALMASRWLGDVLLGRDVRRTRRELRGAPPAVQKYLEAWKEHVRLWGERLGDIRHLFLAGRGPSLAAVGTGALIVKESAHFHAEGMSSAAFRHGPLEMSGRNMLVGVFAGERKTRDLNQRLVKDIREHQGQAELIGEDATFSPCILPPAPAAFRPILEILPVQMITLALAAAVGREPGRFSFCSKVTTTE